MRGRAPSVRVASLLVLAAIARVAFAAPPTFETVAVVDKARAAAFKVDYDQLTSALAREKLNPQPLRTLRDGAWEILLAGDRPLDELSRIVVGKRDGVPIRLADLAQLERRRR